MAERQKEREKALWITRMVLRHTHRGRNVLVYSPGIWKNFSDSLFVSAGVFSAHTALFCSEFKVLMLHLDVMQ